MQVQCQCLFWGKMLTEIIFILFSRVNENELDNRRTIKEVQLTEKVTEILKNALLHTRSAQADLVRAPSPVGSVKESRVCALWHPTCHAAALDSDLVSCVNSGCVSASCLSCFCVKLEFLVRMRTQLFLSSTQQRGGNNQSVPSTRFPVTLAT